VPVYFQHGNRDFMVGREFAAATGVQMLVDPFKLELHGVATLISHGDLYCTDDTGYQRWRRFSRNPAAQAVYATLPRGWRERIAGGIRGHSDAGKQYKPADIMDVNDAAIRQAFQREGVTRMIHGHTHRPATHAYDVDGRRCERHVLADWHPGKCEALRVDAGGVQRVAIAS
jgi:UDP-2,3-diacylglucosamine hydrolase